MSFAANFEAGRYIHASAVKLENAGVLIRGASRAGKSSLADLLMAMVKKDGGHARLVGDDRIALTRLGDHIVLSGHPTIKGLIERRGIGIEAVDFVDSAVLTLVVDLTAGTGPAATSESPPFLAVLGLEVPRLAFDRSAAQAEQAAGILARLRK